MSSPTATVSNKNHHIHAAHMTEKVPLVLNTKTVADAEQMLVKHIHDFDTVNYLYVITPERRLVGVVSIKELYIHSGSTKMNILTKKQKLITVLPETDREEAVYLALQHKIKAIPVVTEGGLFLGVIPSQTLLSILNKELREDILHLSGVQHDHEDVDNILEISVFQAIRHRFPWLVIGLVGGMLAAKIIDHYEGILQKNIILAAFIPLVVYIADAVGTQLEAFTIRDFALFRKLNFWQYFWRQLHITLTISLLLGLTLIGMSLVLDGDMKVALVLGLAITAASISSLITGILIPSFLRQLKFDPANASGPIGTIIQDILSVLIYFSIASWLL